MNSHAGAWELGVSWEDIFCVLSKLSLAGLSRLKWVALNSITNATQLNLKISHLIKENL